MSSAGSYRKRQQRRDQHRFDIIEARRQLADAQLALEQADHHDAEAISEARLAFAAARQRVRDLTSRGAVKGSLIQTMQITPEIPR